MCECVCECVYVCVCVSRLSISLQNRDTGGSDSEREDIELADIKKVLDKHDPGYMKAQALPAHSSTAVSTVASLYQLPLGVERFR